MLIFIPQSKNVVQLLQQIYKNRSKINQTLYKLNHIAGLLQTNQQAILLAYEFTLLLNESKLFLLKKQQQIIKEFQKKADKLINTLQKTPSFKLSINTPLSYYFYEYLKLYDQTMSYLEQGFKLGIYKNIRFFYQQRLILQNKMNKIIGSILAWSYKITNQELLDAKQQRMLLFAKRAPLLRSMLTQKEVLKSP